MFIQTPYIISTNSDSTREPFNSIDPIMDEIKGGCWKEVTNIITLSPVSLALVYALFGRRQQ